MVSDEAKLTMVLVEVGVMAVMGVVQVGMEGVGGVAVVEEGAEESKEGGWQKEGDGA